MNFSDFVKLMDQYFLTKRAQVANAIQTNRDQIYTFTIDLGAAVAYNAKTYRIDKPFKAISFEDGTDQDAYVYAQFDAQAEGKSFKKFKQNAGLNCETMFNGCTIYFPAQAGKTISCTIYYDSTYSSGAQLLSGTIAIQRPSSMALTNPALAAGVATKLFSLSTTDETRSIQNKTGASAWVGPSTVAMTGANTGIELLAGGFLKTENLGDIWVINAAGCIAGQLTGMSEA